MAWIYRGCHSQDERAQICRNKTAGGYPVRMAHGRNPSDDEAKAHISCSASDCSRHDGRSESARGLKSTDLVEWTTDMRIAIQYGRRGGFVRTDFLPGAWQKGSNSEAGFVTWVSQPLLRVEAYTVEEGSIGDRIMP